MRVAFFYIVLFLFIASSEASAQPASGPKSTINGWIVEESPTDDMLNVMLGRIRRMGIKAVGRTYSVELSRSDRPSETWAQRRGMIDDLEAKLSSRIEDDDFEELDEDQMSAKTGVDVGQMVEQMRAAARKSLPYARREELSENFDAPFHFLVDDARCTLGDQGAFLAEVLGIYPIKDEPTDFGYVVVTIVGVGACSSEGAHMDTIKRHLRATVAEFLQ